MIGFYQDKSTAQASHHHVKCFVKSPSFKDLNIDLQFYRDNDVLKLDVKALSNNTDEYQVYFHHQAVSDVEVKTQAKFKNRNKLYTFESRVYDGQHKRIDAELHIDQIRDIDFSVYIYNRENDKSVGIEIHWDANRDPSQNLVFKGSYKKNAVYDYVANFMIIYPGKFVKGDYRFLLERGRLNTLAYLEWDTGVFNVDVDIAYDFETKWFLQFSSKIVRS
nr:unnamed protein product [Callosobruchus chinensis]